MAEEENKVEEKVEEKPEGLLADVKPTEEKEKEPEDIPHKIEEQTNVSSEEKKEEVKLVKPEYLEDKFWDPKTGVKTEDLNTSYKELQKAFSMGKHKAPKEYDITALEGVEEGDQIADMFMEWAKENKPTQAGFDKLVNQFREITSKQKDAESINIEQERKALGPNADQIIQGITTWGKGLVSKGVWGENDFEEFKIFAATANGINALNKIRKYYGENTIPTAPINADGMPSKEELQSMVADPKYKTDPAFRRKVEEHFAKAYPGVATSTGEI